MSAPGSSPSPPGDPRPPERTDDPRVGRPGRIGMLVVAGPGESGGDGWREEVHRSLEGGDEVFLYLVDRGVLRLVSDDLPEPAAPGLRLFACAFGARRYGVPITGPAVFSGLTVLHNLLIGCATFRTVPAPPPRAGAAQGLLPGVGPGESPDRSAGGIVVRIRHDPRESHLPVEGLRIAAGMTIGRERVTVCLDRPAASLLDLPEEEVVDGGRREAYLDILARRGGRFRHIGTRPGEGAGIASEAVGKDRMRAILAGAWRLIVI